MSKNFLCLFFFLLLWGAGNARAATETSYSCLHRCVEGGKTSSECFASCSQDEPDKNHRGTEIDYRCVTLCKQGGKAADACLAQCQYDARKGSNSYSLHALPDGKAALATHESLNAPAPAGDEIVVGAQHVPKPANDKDYQCIPQCLHDGMQYALCNQKCSTVTPEYNKGKP